MIRKSLGAALFVFALAAFGFSGRAANAFAKTVKGNGVKETRNFAVRGFDRIHFALPTEMTVSQDSEYAFELTADANLFDHIDVRVEDGVLTVGAAKGARIKSMKGKVSVSLPEIKEITAAGSGNIVLSGCKMLAAASRLSVTGSGSISADIEAETVFTEISGSGEILLRGKAENLKCSVSGSGEIEAFELPAANADCNITGSGSIEVNAQKTLSAEIAGSGSVLYRSAPELRMNISGSGRCRRVE
ncbi:MAG: head GIN domain-containing protein [Treponema sp.]